MDQRYQQLPSRSYAHCNGDAHHASSAQQQQTQRGYSDERGYVDEREKSPADIMADYARYIYEHHKKQLEEMQMHYRAAATRE